MKKSNPISPELIAPCGMNCAVCSRYLSNVHRLARSQCIGCRPRNQKCTYLFKKCTGMNHDIPSGNAGFCSGCSLYPCREIDRMDRRYRKNYRMSVKENLDDIQRMGIRRFIDEQYGKYRCPKCGGLISVHNRKCFACDTITRLIEKDGKE